MQVSPRGEHGWQYREEEIKLDKDYDNLRIEAQVKDQKGEAYFDGVGMYMGW